MTRIPIGCVPAVVLALLLPSGAAGQLRQETSDPPAGPPSTWLPVVSRWTATLPAPAAASPVAAGDRLFTALFDGRIAAVSLVDGSELWQVERTIVGEPAAGGDLFHAATPEGLLALDAETGDVRWEAGLEATVSAPLLWNAGWLIAALENHELLALNAGSGGAVWRRVLDGGVSARPTIAGDRLYVPLDDGRITVLELLTGAAIWERRLGGAPQEILVAGDIFVGASDNHFYRLSRRDGALRWRWRTGGDVVGLPAVDEDNVYFSSLDNTLWALDRSHGGQRWRELLPARPSAGPRLAEDLVMQGGLSVELNLRGPAGGVVFHRLQVSAELAYAPLAVSDPLGDGLLVVLVTADGELQAVGRGSGPVRLDPADTTAWEKLFPATDGEDGAGEEEIGASPDEEAEASAGDGEDGAGDAETGASPDEEAEASAGDGADGAGDEAEEAAEPAPPEAPDPNDEPARQGRGIAAARGGAARAGRGDGPRQPARARRRRPGC